jgi:putrescine:ornithine antiporter
MSVVQLTFIVAVNMMGSGIIMLPANMAQVGAISLLSWIVTALGSMAIAYGFAQAGIFNQRAGGMAAYAEDAYGKDGYFQVFFLYFLSLAIGNVAIGISAVGYLSTFFPGISATPILTCISVIALLWLTTVANFGGPSITGRIGSITVWGVLIPVGFLSFAGWFWFSSATFKEAWNPQGLSIGAGMSSSISLTLWAFLGMESAAQNSSAVENPKRDVPLACLFGTLGAAVIYILSTAVIQGIVPNAELAKSTGPFGLAYAHMFNPMVGQIVMGLSVLACLGSLLGWQFTIAQTGKDAAVQRMFPQFFTKVNKMGAPIIGMIVLGVVQSVLALSTISPSLSEQFGVLVNLAVVTNVIPYVVSLSAIIVMMKSAGVDKATYTRNVAISLIAMLYSVYALYASGQDAVMGGMLVMGIAYIIWGFIAPRFITKTQGAAAAAVLLLALALPAPAHAQQHAAVTVSSVVSPIGERIKKSGTIRLGYRTDARPFAYKDEAGNPAGFSVDLCNKVVEGIKTEFSLVSLKVEWVPLSLADRLTMVEQGKVDLLCGAETITLTKRETIDFSIPIFPSGIGALLRKDAPPRLAEVLSNKPQSSPVWRANAGQLLTAQTFSVVKGTTTMPWLASKMSMFKLTAKVETVDDYGAGVQQVIDGKANVLFGDRAILLDAATRSASAGDLMVLDRFFTYESLALAMARGDERYVLAVDRALARLYAAPDFRTMYKKWFGEPDADVVTFYRWNALPE